MKEKIKIVLKITAKIFILGFAAFGLILSFSYFAIVKQWTNESGSVDMNNRKFEQVSGTLTDTRISGSEKRLKPVEAASITYKLMVLSKYFPENAKAIVEALQKTGDFALANKMIEAVNIKTLDSFDLETKFKKNKAVFDEYDNYFYNPNNAFDWASLDEWKVLKEAIKKDKHLIDSVGKLLGMEPRLIATVLIGEQIRLFKSDREIYKRALMPLKILSVGNMISYGVTGIKDFTAKDVERNL